MATVTAQDNIASLPPPPALPVPARLPEPFPRAVAANRCVLRVVHMADYHYAHGARQVVTRLRLKPPPVRGWQRRLEHELHVAPLPHSSPDYIDAFGNVVQEVWHERINAHLTVAVEMEVETWCAYTDRGLPLPSAIPAAEDEADLMDGFRKLTPRTTPDNSLRIVAKELSNAVRFRQAPLEFFEALCRRVHRDMHFVSGSTGVDTTAAQAWERRLGVCQDYAHITLALCRLSDIPARYVSGFVPGEGVMHAWVEAFLPLDKERSFWFAYDPTYAKWVDENYVSVAIGCDYGDITPTSGTYYGGPNALKYRNKAERLHQEIRLLGE
jgi:transglutaminase-like putative cysteine protease